MTITDNETTYDIACPFCFRRYTINRALFVDYKNKSEHIYSEYVDYMKNFLGIESPADRQMPLYFQKSFTDGVDSQFSAATETGDITYVRACPSCCNILPAAAGREKPFSIVVIGENDAERGFYISTVLHRLNRRMMTDFGASFIPADHKSALEYFEQYEEPLYVQKFVPEAMTTVYPLVYEFSRFGASAAEVWDKNEITYNRALIYIYNIDKELCDRYPMVAYNAIAQANGIIFLSDISAACGSSDPTCDPWFGYLTETFRRLYGANPVDKPSAVLLCNADTAALGDKKWQALIKQPEPKKAEKIFPASYFSKRSIKIQKIIETRLPSYYASIAALFSKENTIYFPADTFFEMHTDGTADIKEIKAVETSFLWMLSKLDVIDDDSSGNFRIKR